MILSAIKRETLTSRHKVIAPTSYSRKKMYMYYELRACVLHYHQNRTYHFVFIYTSFVSPDFVNLFRLISFKLHVHTWGHILSIVSYTNLDFYWSDKVLQRGVYTDIFTWDIAVSGQECYLGNPLFYIICDIFCFSCLDVK